MTVTAVTYGEDEAPLPVANAFSPGDVVMLKSGGDDDGRRRHTEQRPRRLVR